MRMDTQYPPALDITLVEVPILNVEAGSLDQQ